jgi:hypothetical protein
LFPQLVEIENLPAAAEPHCSFLRSQFAQEEPQQRGLISSYSREKSTAIRSFEKKKETFTIPSAGKYAGEIVVRARIISHHGLPLNFGKPAEGRVVLEQSRTVVLKKR